MATLTVRNLPEDLHRALKVRAARHNRSMEAEARAILEASVRTEDDYIGSWLAAAEELRGEPIPLPERSQPREVTLA